MAGQGNEDDALVEEEDAKELMFPKGNMVFSCPFDEVTSFQQNIVATCHFLSVVPKELEIKKTGFDLEAHGPF